MGKIKQAIIDNELPELPPIRTYIMNGSSLTYEEFISQVALSLYINEPGTDIRKTIDLLLNDDMKELVCSGGDKFFSYIANGETKHSRQYDFDGDISSIVVEKYMETPSRGLRRKVGIIEDPIAGIEHDIVEKYMEEKHPNLNNLDGYIIGIDMGSEIRPLKSYKVSYDVLIVPTIPILQRRKTYKRSEETVQATSFREAREMVKQKLANLGKVTKAFDVELVDTEAVI